MAITHIDRDWGVSPSIVRILSSDSLAAIGTTGYLTAQKANIEAINAGPFEWVISDFALIYSSSDNAWGFFAISSDFASLIAFAFSPTVIGTPVTIGDFAIFQSTSGNLEDLGYSPSNAAKSKVVMAGSAVVANHIALFQDTAGTIDDTAATAINNGSIQAGLSGTAGSLISFPSGATSGELILAAVTNSSGNFNTTISNASAVGQSQVISIPDSGASTGNFIISASAGTQHITSGSLSVDQGNLAAGSSGHAGTVSSFPGTAANGSLILAGVNAGGAFNTTISNGTMGQSTVYSLGDIGAATGGIVVATSAIRMKAVDAAAAAGGAAAQSFTDTFCTSTSVVIGNWVTQANAAEVVKIVPGNGSFVVTSTADAGVGTFSYIIIK